MKQTLYRNLWHKRIIAVSKFHYKLFLKSRIFANFAQTFLITARSTANYPYYMYILNGFFTGLGMIIFVGPVFFTLLQAAFQFGFKSGWAVAFGIIISDVACVILSEMGFRAFFQNEQNQFYMGIAGGFLLLGMGLNYLLNPTLAQKTEIRLTAMDYIGFFTKGFLVNFVNPFVFLVWISIIGQASANGYKDKELYLFLAAALMGIFLTDSLKAYFAVRIKAWINPQRLMWLYKAVGVLLCLFGLILWFRISKLNTSIFANINEQSYYIHC